jgi:NADH-quinone oxidoreductase subunit I
MIGIFKGLLTTLSTAMRRPVTIQYPDVKHPLPVRERSFPILLWDFEHDQPFCTGCNICVRNCPVDCMTATMMDNPKFAAGQTDKKKIVEKFWIDYARCMRCNICVEVCPFEAIAMDNTWAGHEQSVYDRRDLHKDIDDLLEGSRSGRIANPFFPYDDLARLDKVLAGEEPPPPSAQGARPEARNRALQAAGSEFSVRIEWPPRVAQARGPAAAAGAPGAEAPRGDPNSEQKMRARRMKAERAIKEAQARGEPPPPEAVAMLERGGRIEVEGEAAPAAAPGAAPGGAPRGDPNSEQKMRARRMKAERAIKEAEARGEAPPPEAVAMLAAGGRIGEEGAPAAAAAPAPAPPAPTTAPPAGERGDPNSPEKQRARRMRAERAARTAAEARGLAGAELEAVVARAGQLGIEGAKAEDAAAAALAAFEAGRLQGPPAAAVPGGQSAGLQEAIPPAAPAVAGNVESPQADALRESAAPTEDEPAGGSPTAEMDEASPAPPGAGEQGGEETGAERDEQ